MRRALILLVGTALSAGLLAPAATAAPAAKAAPAAYKPPKNAMGQPDFTGYWSNATLTPLTRNPKISSKAVLPPDEAKEFEAIWAKALADAGAPTSDKEDEKAAAAKLAASKLVEIRPDFIAAGGDTGGYNTFWIDPGVNLVQINGEYRTSILTTPNGMPAARKKDAPAPAPRMYRDVYDNPENRSRGERCIAGFGRNADPPMLPNGYYNNNYQIVQTPNEVVINVEMIHDARIIRINGKHADGGPRQTMGDSIGHYEGDTLVVETTNLPETSQFMGSWRNLKVTEWFTRVSPTQILYRFQLEDPSFWDKPWGGEYTFNTLKGIVYEYACHEGNYALPGILGGARHAEAEAKAKAEAAPPPAPPAAPAKGKRGAD